MVVVVVVVIGVGSEMVGCSIDGFVTVPSFICGDDGVELEEIEEVLEVNEGGGVANDKLFVCC